MLKMFRLTVAAVLAASLPTVAVAQEKPESFPTGAIELLTYTDPGTSIDLTLRSLAPLLEQELGQPVVVVNRPGGNGTNAMVYLIRRSSDGSTILGHTTTFSSVMAQQIGGFTGAEVDYLCAMVAEPMAVTVRDGSAFESVDALVAYAKESPGKLRASGGAGAGSYPRLFAMAFADQAGIEFTWVPFDSSTEGRRALLAGDLDFLFTSPGSVDGSRLLAVTSNERFHYTPDTPTLTELGYDIGDRVAWRGLMVRDGTPDDIRQYLIAVLHKVSERPEWRDFVASLEARQIMRCGDDFAEAAQTEIQDTAAQYRRLGIID